MPNFRQILDILEERMVMALIMLQSCFHWMLVEFACYIIWYSADECTDLPSTGYFTGKEFRLYDGGWQN